jgi:hypothetical protein
MVNTNIPSEGGTTHDLLSDRAASSGTNRASEIGAHIASCNVDIILSRSQTDILRLVVVVESEGIHPRFLLD